MNTPHAPAPPVVWTPKSLLDWSEEYFKGKGIPTPRLDGEILLAHVLGCRRIDLYLQFDRPLTGAELSAYRELVRARAGRAPVAYLTGEVGFWNLSLAVGPGCLIPRPDTETLVEVLLEALDELRAEADDAAQRLLCLELGTGTGAIPLAAAGEREHVSWVACDLSMRALAYARENRRRHAHLLAPRDNVLHLVCGAEFGAVSPRLRPHVIVSNPPYVPREVLPTLEPEVAEAEPALALDGGGDGMALHRRLVAHGAEALPPGGRLLLELGAGQGDALRELLAAHGSLQLREIRKDLGGVERVLHATQTGGRED